MPAPAFRRGLAGRSPSAFSEGVCKLQELNRRTGLKEQGCVPVWETKSFKSNSGGRGAGGGAGPESLHMGWSGWTTAELAEATSKKHPSHPFFAYLSARDDPPLPW